MKKQLLQCAEHGPDQLGYVMCIHVKDQPTVIAAHHLAPQEDELGEIFCEACLLLSQVPEDHKILFERVSFVCKNCALKICAGRLPV